MPPPNPPTPTPQPRQRGNVTVTVTDIGDGNIRIDLGEKKSIEVFADQLVMPEDEHDQLMAKVQVWLWDQGADTFGELVTNTGLRNSLRAATFTTRRRR